MEQTISNLMEDSLTEEDINNINGLISKMKVDNDDTYSVLYDLELYFFKKGYKSAMKVISCM